MPIVGLADHKGQAPHRNDLGEKEIEGGVLIQSDAPENQVGLAGARARLTRALSTVVAIPRMCRSGATRQGSLRSARHWPVADLKSHAGKPIISFLGNYGLRHGATRPSSAAMTLRAEDITAFLDAIATRSHVAASTQNQALAALLFLYREVLGVQLPWLDDLVPAKSPVRLPVVLSREEVRAVLAQRNGDRALGGLPVRQTCLSPVTAQGASRGSPCAPRRLRRFPARSGARLGGPPRRVRGIYASLPNARSAASNSRPSESHAVPHLEMKERGRSTK